jgi:hypothetical protein
MIFILFLLCAPAARAAETPGVNLSGKTAAFVDIAPAALGSWHYELLSGDTAIGAMDISVSSDDSASVPFYLYEQTGEFLFSATETRRIRTTVRLKPDLTLIVYRRDTEILVGGNVTNTETITAESGALTVTLARPGKNGKSAETMIKKNGPVYFAPAAAWLLLKIAPPDAPAAYRFDSFIPEPGEILTGTFEVNGMVSRKQGILVEQALRVTVSNGRDVMRFHINEKGGITDFGPESGEIVFKLKD